MKYPHLVTPRHDAATLWKISLPLLVICLGGGCASLTPPPGNSQASLPPSASKCLVLTDDPRDANLGALALVPHPEAVYFSLLQMPLTRSEASAQVSRQATDAVMKDVRNTSSEAILAVPVLWAGAAVGGAIYGVLAGMSEDEAKRVVPPLRQASAGFAPGARLSKTIQAHATELPARSLTFVTESVPVEPPDAATRARSGPYRGAEQLAPSPAPHPLAARNIDTLAILSVAHGLGGEQNINPPQALYLRAHVRLIRTRDWSRAGDFVVEYVSDPRRLAAWAANDAQLLRQEWEIAAQAVEAQVLGWFTRPARDQLSQ